MSWVTFKLGITGSEYTFTFKVTSFSYATNEILVQSRNIQGDVKKSFFKINVPSISMMGAKLTQTDFDTLLSLKQRSVLLNFIYQSAMNIIDSDATSYDASHVKITNTSAKTITILGVWLLTDPTHAGTNYYASLPITWSMQTLMGVLPSADGWTFASSGASEGSCFSVAGGILAMDLTGSAPWALYRRTDLALPFTAGFTIEVRFQSTTVGTGTSVAVFFCDSVGWTESLEIFYDRIWLRRANITYTMDTHTTYHTYRILRKAGNTIVQVDGVTVINVTSMTAMSTPGLFMIGNVGDGNEIGKGNIDYIYYGTYPATGSFDETTRIITLATPLPGATTAVLVNYSYASMGVNFKGLSFQAMQGWSKDYYTANIELEGK